MMSDEQTGLTVMVVDDSKNIRRTMTNLLTKEGYHVVSVVDGFDALATISECQPDIIFADITMPRLDGYQMCQIVKSSTQFAHIPVVMLSSKDNPFDQARARIAGAAQYIIKPFTSSDLTGAIETHAIIDRA